MRRSSRGFTLIEMLMVMVIIAVIASLIVGVSGYANKKAAATRTQGEIKALEVSCESYKVDNGSYPRQAGITEQDPGAEPPIDPRTNGNPLSSIYLAASVFLYQQLSGDLDMNGKHDDTVGVPPEPTKSYGEPFKPSMLSVNATSKLVQYLQDPYGNSYGYSTAGAKAEDEYRQLARSASSSAKGKAADAVSRGGGGAKPRGYNSTFDLWSTAGLTEDPPSDPTRGRWVKNW